MLSLLFHIYDYCTSVCECFSALAAACLYVKLTGNWSEFILNTCNLKTKHTSTFIIIHSPAGLTTLCNYACITAATILMLSWCISRRLEGWTFVELWNYIITLLIHTAIPLYSFWFKAFFFALLNFHTLYTKMSGKIHFWDFFACPLCFFHLFFKQVLFLLEGTAVRLDDTNLLGNLVDPVGGTVAEIRALWVPGPIGKNT